MQICSFLPSDTEILYALVRETLLRGTNLAHDLSSAEIDRDVNQYSSHGEGLYRIDIQRLEAIKPDLIVTQAFASVG